MSDLKADEESPLPGTGLEEMMVAENTGDAGSDQTEDEFKFRPIGGSDNHHTNYYNPATPSSGSRSENEESEEQADTEPEQRERMENDDDISMNEFPPHDGQPTQNQIENENANERQSLEEVEREGDGEWTYEMEEMKYGKHHDTERWLGDNNGPYGNRNDEEMDMSFNAGDGDGDVSQDGSTMSAKQDNSEDNNIKTFKIFVSNLPPAIQSTDLLELFKNYGEVVECEVFAKSYAFVHMPSEESGQKALDELNGFEIQGCKMNLKRSHHTGRSLLSNKEKTKKPPSKPSATVLEVGTCKIYLGNLQPLEVTKELITKLAEEFGKIVEVEIYRTNSAFVHFETEENGQAAIKALNGKVIPGCENPLKVSEARNPDGPSVPTMKLKVSNVPVSLSAIEMRKLFVPYGMVIRVKIFKRRMEMEIGNGRNAVVHLEQFGNIRSAIKDLNGKEIDGQKIKVEAFFGSEQELAPPRQSKPASRPRDDASYPILRNPGAGFRPGMRLVEMPSAEDFWAPPPPALQQARRLLGLASGGDDWSQPPPVPRNRMNLMDMTFEEDYWSPPVPQPGMGRRLIPMPSRNEIARCPRVGPGKSRVFIPPPLPLMAQDYEPYPDEYQGPNTFRNNSNMFAQDDLGEEFGGGYSNDLEDMGHQHGYDDTSFGPPARKVPRNKWNMNKGPPRGSNSSKSGHDPKASQFMFPELPKQSDFPKVPRSILPRQNPSAYDNNDYSADLQLSNFQDFSAVQDFTSDDVLPTSSNLNAMPFDYSQLNNHKRGRAGPNQHNNKPPSLMSFDVFQANRNPNAKPYINSKGKFMVRGNRGGAKNNKGKSRRPGLGTAQQQKKFANQSGEVGPVQPPELEGEAIPTVVTASTNATNNTAAASTQNTTTTNSRYAPYYFQQNWNFKDKRNARHKPTQKEIKDSEEEQKRLYADYLKQKPWLYQAIPGTVKKVQK